MNNCTDVPIGFITFCKEDNKRYEYTSEGWTEFKSSITDEEAEKLNIAYLHSQTQHIQASDLEGFATEEFVTNKIAEAGPRWSIVVIETARITSSGSGDGPGICRK